MLNGWIWGSAALAYGLFRLGYDNRGGKLTAAEIEMYLSGVDTAAAGSGTDIATLRRFLQEDDGREFVMVNLVRFAPGEIAHPDTGVPSTGRALMQIYARRFVPGLFRRGGHPAIAARKVGGYLDSWRVPPDPGWDLVGFMRYRSRRDMIRMATDPRFADVHKFKIAGIAETFSFPTQVFVQLFVGPRVVVGLLLALAAALAQIAVLSR